MASLAPRTRKTLEELEALMASASIPPRIARSCEHLVERLRRPIRVGLIGFETGQRKRLLNALLETEVLPEEMAWPTIEIGFAETPHTKATLADGSTLSADGMPRSDLLDRDAVFLKVAAPIEALRRVTLLHLAAGEDADEQSAALRWAARRVDFALWCTRDFSSLEARIWNAAAPELRNHAYLVAFASEPEAPGLCGPTPPDFERVMFVPTGNPAQVGARDMQIGARKLFEQLASDIDDALGEDLDAARVLLLRCGRGVGASEQAPAPPETRCPAPAEADPQDVPETAELVDLLSEPLIFLKRQTRDLFEALEWHDSSASDWAGEVLERCCDVTDGLRDRAAGWPEDVGPVSALRGLVEEAADMATLLQIEGGSDQAEDAAALLIQVRSAFEASLARPAPPVN